MFRRQNTMGIRSPHEARSNAVDPIAQRDVRKRKCKRLHKHMEHGPEHATRTFSAYPSHTHNAPPPAPTRVTKGARAEIRCSRWMVPLAAVAAAMRNSGRGFVFDVRPSHGPTVSVPPSGLFAHQPWPRGAGEGLEWSGGPPARGTLPAWRDALWEGKREKAPACVARPAIVRCVVYTSPARSARPVPIEQAAGTERKLVRAMKGAQDVTGGREARAPRLRSSNPARSRRTSCCTVPAVPWPPE